MQGRRERKGRGRSLSEPRAHPGETLIPGGPVDLPCDVEARGTLAWGNGAVTRCADPLPQDGPPCPAQLQGSPGACNEHHRRGKKRNLAPPRSGGQSLKSACRTATLPLEAWGRVLPAPSSSWGLHVSLAGGRVPPASDRHHVGSTCVSVLSSCYKDSRHVALGPTVATSS